jgi:uncharacterized RDD family membrane protein YckC
MKWYYAKNKERLGPFDETQFGDLVRSGEVTGSTLVWNETLPGWKKFAEVRDAAYGSGPAPVPSIPDEPVEKTAEQPRNSDFCSQCRRVFDENELLTFEGQKVCASCKPAFVQKLREGVSVGDLVYAGFWIRFVAKFIDGIVLSIINMVIGFFTTASTIATNPADPVAALNSIMFSGALQFCVQAAYSSFFLGKFSATPGKMVMGLKVISVDSENVSYMKGLGRAFAEIVSSIILCIGYLMAAWDPEKRALHDRICNTRVVKAR